MAIYKSARKIRAFTILVLMTITLFSLPVSTPATATVDCRSMLCNNLLQSSQVPSTWRFEEIGDSNFPNPFCPSTSSKTSRWKTAAADDFHNLNSMISEVLLQYANASSAYTNLVAHYAKCVVAQGNIKTMLPIRFRHFGDSSAAWLALGYTPYSSPYWHVSSKSSAIAIIVRKGSVIMVMTDIAPHKVSVPIMKSLITKALSDLP